jgi:hypothetical protein
LEKNLVVYGVKGCRKVQKDESRNFLLVTSSKEVVRHTQEGSFCRMEFSVSRLVRGYGRKGLQVVVDSVVYDAFENF